MKLMKQDTCYMNPWTELDRFFGQALSEDSFNYTRSIPVTAYNTENDKVLEMELPGVDKKDLNLSFERGVLDVQATRKLNHSGNAREVRFAQSIRVGTEFDFKKAEAALVNGILTITLPKSEQVKPFRISVN